MAIFFSKIFSRKGKRVIGLDIGSSAIKVVELSLEKGKPVLKTYGALALGPYAGVEIGRSTRLPVEKKIEAVVDILREAKTTTKSTGLSVPFSSSLMALTKMPLVNQKELATMVPLEARKYIPVPISEVTLNWSIIPRYEGPGVDADRDEDTIDVLIVAIHNKVLEEYQQIISSTDIDVGFLEIEVFSAMRSVLDQEVAPLMIFDMGAASTKLYLVERGIIRESHIINRGSQDITLAISRALSISVQEAELIKRENGLTGPNAELVNIIKLNLNYIFSESNRILLNYQKKYRQNVDKLVMIGGGAALRGLGDAAQESLQTRAVLGDPFSKIENPSFADTILKETGPEFAVAVGAALRRLTETQK
jgi:type IV pilus assembly protein PilM